MNITTTYNDEQFLVDQETLEIQHNGCVLRPYLNKQHNRWYIFYKDPKGKCHSVTRARIICQAFHPNDQYQCLQTDHIDSNPANDVPSNLRWVTRKENNSTPHSIKMRKKNSRCTSHKKQVIKATCRKTGKVMYFANGIECARFLKCSHTNVYLVLDKSKTSYKSAKGWLLEWVSNVDNSLLNELKSSRRESLKWNTADKAKKTIAVLQKKIEYLELRNELRAERAKKIKNQTERLAKLKQKYKQVQKRIEESKNQVQQIVQALEELEHESNKGNSK